MIRSFACRDTKAVFEGRSCRRFANIRTVLERKLVWLDAAVSLNGLCFIWTANGPENVECVDYH